MLPSKISNSELSVRLESINISGYRSCKDTYFSPNNELSALIGINGAGKTNILQAIRLLHPSRARATRRVADTSVTSSTLLTAWFLVNEAKIGLQLVLNPVDSPRKADAFSIEERWQLASLTGQKKWVALPPIGFFKERPVESDAKHIFFYHDDMLAQRNVERIDKANMSLLENNAVVDTLLAIDEFRSGITYYSASQFTDPSRCPSSFEVDEDGRSTDSIFPGTTSAHQRFLYNLYSLRQSNLALYNEYCRFVSRSQLGLVSRITWKEVELSTSTAEVKNSGTVKKVKKRKTLVIPKVQIGSSHITFNQLSEGTFKTLALAFYIITDSSKFLMIEEPEVCVHHGLLRKIIGTIKSHAHRKQTIISTHSDLLVDELEPQNLFVVEMRSSGTSVAGLEDWLSDSRGGLEALHNYLAESGSLGEYWRSGGLN